MIATESKWELFRFTSMERGKKPEGRSCSRSPTPRQARTIAEVPCARRRCRPRGPARAHEAFLKWREVPVVDRVQALYRYKTLLEKHASDLARILTSENGKTADDARAEVRRAIQMVEVACGMPSLMMGDSLDDVARGHRLQDDPPADRRVRRHHAVQFPRDGADVDVPVRDRVRQCVCAEAVGKGSADPHAAVELLHDAGLPRVCCNLVNGVKLQWTRCCIIRW